MRMKMMMMVDVGDHSIPISENIYSYQQQHYLKFFDDDVAMKVLRWYHW